MSNLDTIFDNLTEYSENIEDLVAALKAADINNYDEFINAAKEAGVPVKKSMRDEIAERFSNTDGDDWAEAKKINTKEAYQNYLSSHPEGAYRNDARDCIYQLEASEQSVISDEAWDSVDKTSIESIQSFIGAHPNSQYRTEAINLLKELIKESYMGIGIDALIKQIEAISVDKLILDPETAIFEKIAQYINNKKITPNDLINAIADDNNLISSAVARKLWDKNIIADFSPTGIEGDFIAHMMCNIEPKSFDMPKSIERITKTPCTEIYFWGIPSSGKTCALGAILSSANSGRVAVSMQKEPDCQGYGYMTELANIFEKDRVCTLPAGTPTHAIYEMGFILEDKSGKEHHITCIDLAGELTKCMYKHDAGKQLTDQQQEVLNTLTSILIDNRTSNRKMHFFVLEYGAENREYEGLPQRDWLDAAVAYIQRTGIFQKDTDAIYLLITKADKAKAVGPELQNKLRDYITNNYQAFYNGLKKICKQNEINGGNVMIQPFTLGKVCFQNYCKFKDDTAAAVVEIIMNRSYGYKPGKINNIFNRLKK